MRRQRLNNIIDPDLIFVNLNVLQRLRDQETQRRQAGRDLQSFKERQHELDLLQMKVGIFDNTTVQIEAKQFSLNIGRTSER